MADSPTDEKVYQQPAIIQWWVDNFGGPPMDPNMIHRYIQESPFFDHMSNNGLNLDQANHNPRAYDMSWNRQMFEDDLRKKRGVEFMIVGEPQPVPPTAEGEKGGWMGTGKNGVYVIRKQERQFERRADGRLEEDLTTLGTYYIIGENMYQAPSVGEVIGNRLVSAANNLSQFLDTAKQLPSFDPTRGYTYLPNATTANKAAGSTTASLAPTPSRSRETSVVPGMETQSLRSTSVNPADPLSTTSQPSSLHLLASSLQLSQEYSSEYMDENPLNGTPGNFSFTHSAAAIKKRRADEAAAAAQAVKVKAERESNPFAVPPEKRKAPSPPAVMTEAKAGGGAKERVMKEERRNSKMGDKIRRKKSRVGGSALTPGGPAAGTGGTG